MRILHHPIVLLLLTGLITWGLHSSMQAPAALAENADEAVFSAGRAEPLLNKLLAENQPHPSGTAENRRIRDRIETQLGDWGYEVEIQSAFHCNPQYGSCSPVDNIIAVHPGSVGKNAVLLTAHYDSAWAGAGVADDGAGTVAVLEIARMLRNSEPLENDVIILITDGEEKGLIGAHLFASEHPLFGKVKAVINLESRGVAGVSAMFETGDGNRRIIRELSSALSRPVANSLTYEIYKRMPNDTDYSVYRDRDVMGVNFAITQGVAAYHSVRDDLDNLDRGSLQHHGDNAWEMVQALGAYNLDRITSNEDAVYIDFFGLVLWHYPASIAGGIAIFLTVLLLAGIGYSGRGEFRLIRGLWSLAAVLLSLVLLPLGGYLLSWPLGQWVDSHALAHPFPWVGRATLFLMLILVLWSAMRATAGRKSIATMTLICWGTWSGMAVWLAYNFPSASYIALVPMFAFFAGMVLDIFRRKSETRLVYARLLGFTFAAYVGIYHFLLLDVVLNFEMAHVKILPLWFLSLAALPMLLDELDEKPGGNAVGKILVGMVVLGCLAQQFIPGFTPDRPREMALMYQESAGAESGYLVLESLLKMPDKDYAYSHGFTATDLPSSSGAIQEKLAKPVPPLQLTAPTLIAISAQEEEGGWNHSFTLTTGENAQQIQLTLDRSVSLRQIRVNGLPALDTSARQKRDIDAWVLSLAAPAGGPLNIEFITGSEDRFAITSSSQYALPGKLVDFYLLDWPEDAQPAFLGPRAIIVQTHAFE